MSRKYFGTDGIRGTVGSEPMVPDFILRLANAVGRVLRAAAPPGRRPAVLIGKDTRVSGYMIESAMESGFIAAGVDVVLCGPMPTPGVAYLTRALRLDLGVVISASHNAYPDNGIKFFSAEGQKLPDAWEAAVEAELDRQPVCEASRALGKARRLDDATGRYVEFCKSTFPNALSLKGLSLVVDCAHGAAYQAAPAVFHELGAQVTTIGSQPNGLNINDGCGATQPQALIDAVLARQADYGIALDGDADRLQMVDRSGRLFNGDELLYLLAIDRLADRAGAGVVGTQMTNMAVEQALAARQLRMERAKVGDRYVMERLLENGWTLGGEGSGHLILLDCHSTGDGVIAALQVLRAVVRSGRSIAEQLASLRLFPQILHNVRVDQPAAWQRNAALTEALRAAEQALDGRGRVLVRPSGTEPVLRIMVEAAEQVLAQTWVDRLSAAAEQHG
jgi:phosphoglucosamine mutase